MRCRPEPARSSDPPPLLTTAPNSESHARVRRAGQIVLRVWCNGGTGVDDRAEQLAGVRQGQLLAGKYRVEFVLGVGGMGVVVAARHIELESRVALKFLLPALLSNPDAVARFAREARAAVRIQNEHVARVLDVGTLENGAPYLVMEFLEGVDLSTWLAQRGALPIEQAVEFVLQACVAVADAHSLGIIHRDLKPANLFCIRRSDKQFIIKVLDFGISKLTEAGRTSDTPGMAMTKTAAVMGSPLYMSPEQMRSAKDVDARTDIWALGIILFQLVANRAPFLGESVAEVAIQVGSDPPPALRGFRPDAPPGLEAVIFRCLEKDPRNRYGNVAELALALLPFAPKRGRGLVDRITGILHASSLSASAFALPDPLHGRQETLVARGSVSGWSGTFAGSKSKKALLWAVGATGVLGAGGWALAVHHGRSPDPAPGPESPAREGGAASPVPPEGLPDPRGGSIEASAPALCAAEDTRCSGATRETCAGGQWVHGAVAAGQCGAVCTPGSSPARCSAGEPERCGSTGQWEAGLACSKSSACRNGVCVPASPSPPPRKPDCDPPFTLDDQGQKHFKHECYPK
jgi:serine/threonine protein kinase